ncbi:hypothetical protein CKALI_03645 [Corynebacterium kalinowskii]|uniref:Uncharacterized protein n=1 Tax=Corynebacterium kalinowskii TaxID=2675216 RepID=A0A6B8V950_9CORY|nr:hypothetical protein [Corynebacterium kalinowskii]QGU01612.1 hypothetical protein CKALI_03645 [Corynebacterium kalinowskii]
MPNSTLLIDARRASTLPEAYALIAGNHQPTPRNLDGFADYLREVQVKALVLRGCRLQIRDYTSLANVCRDQGVKISTLG